jgi:hypothetical protein
MSFWLNICSEKNANDIVHSYKISEYIINREYTIIPVVLEYKTDEIYLLFRYFENFIDMTFIFYDLDIATKEFYKNVSEYQYMLSEDEFQVLERSYNRDLQATIYMKNTSSAGGNYYWSENSTRWVLKTIKIEY